MDFSKYQKQSGQTRIHKKIPLLHQGNIMFFCFGLFGEVGEVAEKIKKIMREKNGILKKEDKQEIAKELGDVLWYLTQLGDELGYSLNEIAEMNLKKIESRKKRGLIKGNGDNR